MGSPRPVKPDGSARCSWQTDLAVPPKAQLSLRDKTTGLNERLYPLRDNLIARVTVGQSGAKSLSSFHNYHGHLPPGGLGDRKDNTVNFRGDHLYHADSITQGRNACLWMRFEPRLDSVNPFRVIALSSRGRLQRRLFARRPDGRYRPRQ